MHSVHQSTKRHFEPHHDIVTVYCIVIETVSVTWKQNRATVGTVFTTSFR